MRIHVTKSGYDVIQILEGRSNSFLLTNGKNNILVDTGPAFMRKILEKRLKTLKISHLDLLILTHTHFDHSANTARIREKYKPLVIVHKNEAPLLAAGKNIIPKGTNRVTRIIVNLLPKQIVSQLRYKPCQYDLTTDTVFDLHDFGFNAKIMHTPGHTTGSMSVIIDDEIALVGDTMFGVFKGSAFPPFADDVKQMLISWGRLLETGCTLFLPSHGSALNRIVVQKDFEKRTASLNLSL
jgi:hydroxyacylglutathione hydrolase